MPPIARVATAIRNAGGVCSITQLRERGIERDEIVAAFATGTIQRIRRGWYSTPGANGDVVRAVRVGGVATATTVLRTHGIWMPRAVESRSTLHVRVGRGASRLRAPDLVEGTLHPLDRKRDLVCLHHRDHPLPASAFDPLPLALAEMLRCAEPADAIAMLDSALSKVILQPGDVNALRDLTMPSRRWIIDRSDPGSESGIETRVRTLLRSRRIRHRSQVRIAGVGWVDLLVGDRLVLEVDGSQYHSGDDEFEQDRRRDFELAIRGYLVIRLSYRMVTDHWDALSEQLLGIVARGEHRWGYRAQAYGVAGRALPRFKVEDDGAPAPHFSG